MKSKVLLISLVLLLMFGGCGKPSDEDIAKAIESTRLAEATSIPSPTITPEITEVVCSIDEEQNQDWETVFCETFDNNDYEWETGLDTEFGTDSKLEGGIYTIEFDSANQSGYQTGFSLATPFWGADDYVVNIFAGIDSRFKQCTWGVLVNGFYDTGIAFEVDNQGNYFITNHGADGDIYIGNAKSGSHSALNWDAPNTITVVSEDEMLTFFINGEFITTYEYDRADNNAISISLWAAEGVRVSYEFDHILVREK